MFKISLSLAALLTSTPVFCAESVNPYGPGGQFYEEGKTVVITQEMVPPLDKIIFQQLPGSDVSNGDKGDLSTLIYDEEIEGLGIKEIVKAPAVIPVHKDILPIITDIEGLSGNEISEAQQGKSVDFKVVAEKINNIKSALTKAVTQVDKTQQLKIQEAIQNLDYMRGAEIAEAMQGMEVDFGEVSGSLRQIMKNLATIH